ncbi:PH domain-containing protein [Peribacillus asahii]|uniref:PH domain-containing protein n=1 Tax=Peribacillus asahii TaxID=228899 RepID=UPI00207AE00D|nr:PH domain-containing protein [Peribacillus asahii]USK60778.1 PH domain-containing protein [Peribacillus asahii]
MEFSSKKDIWMGIIIWAVIGVFVWIFYESTFIEFDLVGIIVMTIMIGLLLSIWFWTRYKIEQGILKISYGPIKKSIAIEDIQSIRLTVNPFTAPALSMYRIEINYRKYKTISISPINQERFIKELQKLNPKIRMMGNK